MEKEKSWRGQAQSAREARSGPADEYEALREQLLTVLRRQPGDMAALLRHAGSLARIAPPERRLSPRKAEYMAQSFRAVFASLGDQILPPD